MDTEMSRGKWGSIDRIQQRNDLLDKMCPALHAGSQFVRTDIQCLYLQF